MPPFFDRVQAYQAVNRQAIPALEAIAANDNLRSLRRFERDDPPPYVSSTESEEIDDDELIRPFRRPMPDDLKAIMEHPINDNELNQISGYMYDIVYPDDFYYKEAMREYERLEGYGRGRGPTPEMFRGLNGARRRGVITRHNVKRRWEKLGVWNPKWGFAGRKLHANDDFSTWTWRWQPDGARADNDEAEASARHDARELVARALRLRQNLRRSEYAPVLPRSRLRQDTTVAEAEAFLISRPWFIFQIEVAEEDTRYSRLSIEDRRRYPHSAGKQVIKWWKERGDWRDEFNTRSGATYWKWRHESPSPEPEDLAPIDNMRNSPLDAAAAMEFTPEEITELETIDLPRSEQPEGFWVIEDGDLPPYFPGQMCDEIARVRKGAEARAKIHEKLRAEGKELPGEANFKRFKERFFPGQPFRLFGPPQVVEHGETPSEEHEVSSDLKEDPSESQRGAVCPPPQKRRRLRHRQQQDEVDVPQPRRSARIAGMKRPAEPLPSQTAPNKRTRGRPAPKAAASTVAPASQPPLRETHRTSTKLVPARVPANETTETQLKQGRGRPKKESGPSMHEMLKSLYISNIDTFSN
ncbi:hypothetical protein HD806DRAFT_520008 [Xylariaceae sp. AK1471]|nr:hypothetical protein HD806DRAFT_520008 [Xylariaceae sp. AK1471]